MADSAPTTKNSQDDQQAESLEQIMPDGCGIQRKKSSDLTTGEAPVHEDSDDYNMNHPNRGKCLVFNHTTYDDRSVHERFGTFADVTRIQRSFGNLGFDVEVCHNKTCDEIKTIIKHLSKQNHKNNDCVCIIVLTHGQNDNTIQAKDKLYPLNVLWERFTADKCVSLAGKPKLFFISACRGNKPDQGVLLRGKKIPSERTQTDGCGESSYVIPTESDFLFGFSSAPGYVSMRSEETGTWYIQSLCNVLDQYAATTHLADMLTKTAQLVAKRVSHNLEDRMKHNKKQVPECHTRLLRRVYFTPKRQEAIAPQNSLQANSEQDNGVSKLNDIKSNYCNTM